MDNTSHKGSYKLHSKQNDLVLVSYLIDSPM